MLVRPDVSTKMPPRTNLEQGHRELADVRSGLELRLQLLHEWFAYPFVVSIARDGYQPGALIRGHRLVLAGCLSKSRRRASGELTRTDTEPAEAAGRPAECCAGLAV